MADWDLPSRLAVSSWLMPYVFIRRASPSASSMKSRSLLCKFSTIAISEAFSMSISITIQGTVARPASLAALSLRSPATSSYVFPVFLIFRGWSIPYWVMLSASPLSALWSKKRRGCIGLGFISSTGTNMIFWLSKSPRFFNSCITSPRIPVGSMIW